MNTITVSGNLTRDPELRFTNGGRPLANMGVAVNRRYQVNGEWQEDVAFMNVVAWGSLAENVASSLSKGDKVLVSGRIQTREYENRDGAKVTATEIVADEIGASLANATVEVQKVVRSKPNVQYEPKPAAADDDPEMPF